MNTLKFVARRLAFYLITAWAAITLNFFLPRMMPGDPVKSLMSRYQGQMSADAINSLYVLFGLDKKQSTWTQYLQYWSHLANGDLGLSFTYFPTPVSAVISQTLPWTLGLVGAATILSFLIGTRIGVALGWHRGTLGDLIVPVATFFSSVPYFWVGLLAILLFAVTSKVFPAAGGYTAGLTPSFTWPFIVSVIEHAALPILTIVISSISGWIIGMRNMMVTVSSEDYVTVAHAKGLSDRKVMNSYAARNAILPQISGFALSLGFIVGGTLVMEMVFSYPGIGYTLYLAVQAKDYPLMQGIFLIITLSVLAANVLADMLYAVLDPRTREGR